MRLRGAAIILGVATLLLTTRHGIAGNGAVVVGISPYNIGFDPSGNSGLPNADVNGAGFYSSLKFGNLVNPTDPPFSGFMNYFDNVADWMFYDPDLGALGFGDDVAWDNPQFALAYYSGHGANPNLPNPTQTCSVNTDCTAPNSGTSLPGVCILVSTGNYCYYNQTSDMVVDGNPGLQAYGFNGALDIGLMAWGESPTSGTWAHAGTNGGLNGAILDMSHGTKPMMWQEQLVPPMAGIHFIGTCMPANGDTASVADRGQAFGDAYLVNPKSSVMDAWAFAMAALAQNDGGACANNNFGTGGGFGFNGCGCNVALSADTTTARANAHQKETWITVRDDSLDAQGAIFDTLDGMCNYDTQQFPLIHN